LGGQPPLCHDAIGLVLFLLLIMMMMMMMMMMMTVMMAIIFSFVRYLYPPATEKQR